MKGIVRVNIFFCLACGFVPQVNQSVFLVEIMICRGKNRMGLDVKIDPDLFVGCRLSKICFSLFDLVQYGTDTYLCVSVCYKILLFVLFCNQVCDSV